MTEPLALGEKLLGLLDESQRVSTYKPALLLALVDRAAEFGDSGEVPVRVLSERVIELYWQQTLPFAGEVLSQNSGSQAAIVSHIRAFRELHNASSRALPDRFRRGPEWNRLVERVERSLAEMPIPRLQNPYPRFLYDFSWGWDREWSARDYWQSSRTIVLKPGVADALISLGPLLRPFIVRWWTDKAAQLNRAVPTAEAILAFEDFLFGSDRVALGRVAEGLLDFQLGSCFYCATALGRRRQVDHFIPWSHSGDDGLDNLVVACSRCNNQKRATLAGPHHLGALLERNATHSGDLTALAREKTWPRDQGRSFAIAYAAYLRSPDDRPTWTWAGNEPVLDRVASARDQLRVLLDRADYRTST